MKKLRDQKGFTALELMVVTGISTMICYSMFVALRTGNEQMETVNTKMTIQDSAREGLYKMIQEIRLSSPSQITILNGGNSIQFNIPDPNNPILADYTTDWANSFQITYALGGTNNAQVLRTSTATPGVTTVMANDVSAINFAANGGTNVVTVTMSVQRALINTRTLPGAAIQMIAQAEIRNP